ncbi:MAG: ribulose-phosphate 3-epimerase [Flavobacteriaceae bacterium]|nr:ribulose-phosphate 3-epimerase [Flavobacteriaceae bacterium]
MKKLIAPSILAADFGNLERDCKMINESSADWFHIDIMDGVFVPNISFGMPVLASINNHAEKPLDVHLMIVNPDRYIKKFSDLNAEILTIHYEVCDHLHRSIQEIKSNGMKAGVALNPHTPISVLDSIINDIDLVCLMSVNPGFGGQKFIKNTFKKIRALKTLIDTKNSNTLIEIDGGVTDQNAKELIETGADVLVAGSFVFKSNNPLDTITNLKSIIN